MTDQFLPTDYQVPGGGGKYMKLLFGDNRFRILSFPILGWEYWKDLPNGKRQPVRMRMSDSRPDDLVDPGDYKHFWAMVVFNYATKNIEILELTQGGIQKTLRSLSQDADWGSPVLKYDIVITRTGEGMETRYLVLPKPATKLEDGVLELFKNMEIDLTALYRGEDPFGTKPLVGDAKVKPKQEVPF